MTRHILSLIVLAILTAGIPLNAEPPPNAESTSSKTQKKSVSKKSQARTDSRIAPETPLAEGWTYVKGEWIHPDGYKYVKGQVVRTASGTHKTPPKPPSRALLSSVKTKPAPTPDPNSAAAKSAERERNLTPRPASQTGTHL